MLVLALDTATPAVTAGVVEVTADAVATRSVRVTHDARKHGELLMPGALAACAEAGVALRGRRRRRRRHRAGPVHRAAGRHGHRGRPRRRARRPGARGLLARRDRRRGRRRGGGPGGRLLVVTDARRREVYWAAYDGRRRIAGPHVEAPAALADRIPGLGAVAAAGASAGVTGLPVVPPDAPGPAGLVACARRRAARRRRPGPLEPLYLRRPDAVAPGPRKPVTAG